MFLSSKVAFCFTFCFMVDSLDYIFTIEFRWRSPRSSIFITFRFFRFMISVLGLLPVVRVFLVYVHIHCFSCAYDAFSVLLSVVIFCFQLIALRINNLFHHQASSHRLSTSIYTQTLTHVEIVDELQTYMRVVLLFK